MDDSFAFKLKETFQVKDISSGQDDDSVQNPEPEEEEKDMTILVRFNADVLSHIFDPAFLKYSLHQIVCENEDERKVMASHCQQENARFFREIGNKAEELKCYEMLLKTNPNNLSYLSKVAELAFQMDRLDTCINYYKIINSLYPTHSKYFYNLAVCFRKAHRWYEAKAILSKYLQMVPDDIEGYKNLADVMIELKQRKQAVRLLQKGLKISSEDSQIFNTLGNLYLSVSIQKAKYYYSRGVLANPSYSYNFNGLGVIYNSIYQFQHAIRQFQLAISLNNKEPDFHYNLAVAYKHLKQIDQARQQFKICLQIDSTYYLSLQGLGNLSMECQDYTQAICYYKLVLEHSPSFTNALYNLSVAYQRNNNMQKAAQFMRVYLDANPTDFNAYHYLADLKIAIRCKERQARRIQKKKMPRLNQHSISTSTESDS